MESSSPYVMSPSEIAFGMPFGYTGSPKRADDRRAGPRAVLEGLLRDSLASPPCGVAFSGGRDSSLVLAVATFVARRDGFPDPVPLTKVFPTAPDTDETEWQEMVVRHLELEDWERIVLDDELDLIGPIARRHLEEHGVVWSPMAHANAPLYSAVRGGSLLDGEGGDEVLGVEAHRVAPLNYLVRTKGRRWRRHALATVAPRRIRSRRARIRRADLDLSWLRPAARRQLTDSVVDADVRRPLPFAKSVRLEPMRRSWVLGERSRRALAMPYEVDTCSPLLNPDFVDALGRDRWLLGIGDRTDVLRLLAEDLLPRPVIERMSKASFGGSYWGRYAKDFIAQWRGDGLDPELVDPEALSRLWSSGNHHAMTSALLQQAWLATQHSSR